MPIWPRPERLLPPRLVEALAAIQSGDTSRALELCAGLAADDPLAGDVVRFVRGRAALGSGDRSRARRDLRRLARSDDEALALLATQALADDLVARRRYAEARPLLRRFRTSDSVTRLWLDAAVLGVDLQRHGSVPEPAVAALEGRLERRHPPVAHAAVHVLRAERSMLAGELAAAVQAHRTARPFVRASGDAAVARRHETVAQLLRAPFAEAEDWQEPRRPVTREDLAALDSKPWQLWIDLFHRRARRRIGRRSAPVAIELDARGTAWDLLVPLVRSANLRLAWSQACAALEIGDSEAGRARAERLARDLRTAALPVRTSAEGIRLDAERFVLVFAATSLPGLSQRLVARLASAPGATATDLTSGDAARRTVVRHLGRLRQQGLVRMVGGGNEERYFLV